MAFFMTKLVCAVVAVVLFGTLSTLAAGASMLNVQNNSGDPVNVWVLTSSGGSMYGMITLNNGDRYVRYDIDRAVVVRIHSARCSELQATLTRADWSVVIDRTATGCTLVTSSKSRL